MGEGDNNILRKNCYHSVQVVKKYIIVLGYFHLLKQVSLVKRLMSRHIMHV